MDALRKAIARYADRLDAQAARHEAFAVILNSVAHRLRAILDNNPAPFMHKELGVMVDGKFVPLDLLGEDQPPQTPPVSDVTGKDVPVYVRWVTPWKETK